ncbi:hypothetical protein [Planctomycetes bacterium Poly30]
MRQHSQGPRAKREFKFARQVTGRQPDRGSASPLLLASLAILLAAGVAAWFLMGPERSPSPAQTVQPEASADAGADDRPKPPPGMMRESDLIALEAKGPRTVGGIETRPAGGYESFEKVFGAPGGTVTGEIRVAGAEYPEAWTVTIEPSLVAEGRAEAITKTFVSEPGMRTFELRDLPLAAYRLSASAPGLTTSKVEVALYQVAERPGQRGLDYVTVDLTLRPMARVEGFVRQPSGEPASDLAVYLVPYVVPGADAGTPDVLGEAGGNEAGGTAAAGSIETKCNSAGSYAFENVPPGPWMLHVGDAINPLASPIPVGVQTADQRVDDVVLPPLATLELVVLDHLARPCPDVILTGYLRGKGAGHFKVTTDATGRIKVPYLTPGPWRIDAEDPLMNQKGRGDYSLTPEGPADGRIRELHIR